MRKRIIVLLLALLLAASVTAASANTGITWTEEARARLRIGNPTALQGRFFTSMWGGTTSDMDVQDLLHAYSPVRYDIELTRFRFDHSVIQDAVAMDDAEGNRTYILVFYDDLLWSDGTPITAADYAFSILFCMDPAIAGAGGKPMDYSWIVGSDEYLDRSKKELSGLRILSEDMLQVQVKAEALPYFYELSRFRIFPYPISVLAPGNAVMDDGAGAYLSEPLTPELIGKTVTDPETGYLSHPSVVSGAYTLIGYEGTMADFQINPYFKGTEEGLIPRIGELEYSLVDNKNLVELLSDGYYGLLNKVTLMENIRKGIEKRLDSENSFTFENYARTGLTMLWFLESSPMLQEPEVRRAIAYCFDRDSFVRQYVGPYGLKMDCFCGLGQWMYRLASGQMGLPVDESLPEEERLAAEAVFEGLTLDGLSLYSLDMNEANRQLQEAGWQLDNRGFRVKTVDGQQKELELVIGIPASAEAMEYLEEYFVRNLEDAGILVTLKTMDMDEIVRNYRGEVRTADVLYLGENFSIRFDPEILAPYGDTESSRNSGGGIPAVKAELYEMAKDMVKTEPEDIAGFMRKWIALQERITETLPLLPVYSNVYFDFFSREVHDYMITRAVTWSEAIIKSFISDREMITEEEHRKIEEAEQAGIEVLRMHRLEKELNALDFAFLKGF